MGLLVLGEVKLWEVELAILILVTGYYVVVIVMRVLMPHLIMIIMSNCQCQGPERGRNRGKPPEDPVPSLLVFVN